MLEREIDSSLSGIKEHKSNEQDSSALKIEIVNLKQENERLQSDLQKTSSAADRNSVKLGKVTRQNAAYLERIKELEDEIRRLKEVNQASLSTTESSQF